MGCLELFEARINAGAENPVRYGLRAAGISKRSNDCEVAAGTAAHFESPGAAVFVRIFAWNPGHYLPWLPANNSFRKVKRTNPFLDVKDGPDGDGSNPPSVGENPKTLRSILMFHH